jgi:trehalose synthase
VDPDRPILAAISRYDVHKNQAAILEAFRLFRREKRTTAEPYLIFMGNTATDDPEGGAVLRSLQEEAAGDPDVRFLVNVEDNDRVVGALMRKAAALVHVSTREGFGLVVAEALWQGTPVIGSRVGGIVEQVIDGDTGLRVDPMDVHAIARSMSRILDDPGEAEILGRQGREHVRRHFLLPEIMRRYLVLLRRFNGIDRMKPGFRLNGLSYGEYQGLLRAKQLQQGLASLGCLAS